ncbi:SGNH/GDSL hydrolase family protein [Thalassobacillus pellis]|uniref:SGNH/GDSL hydrolase family protein n=1 Tax=Thalassobacillus pellis TaxID=748008 RepID=UPI0019619AD7|nr:SGNH/GDSL hydrolase family protein [Thalassobacillus pellis]MBM7551596.1 lysophospholipase L1-like esterase [Thalassobacillus pellis]
MKVVFIGDSITESGKFEDEEQLGKGYVRLICDYLRVAHPEADLEFFNKGISGNRITDLAERWQEDVINLQPDLLSVSIGINDVWRQLDNPDMEQVDAYQFEKIYKQLLDEVKSKTDATLVLMEPTIIEENIESAGNQKLKDYVEVVQDVAEVYDAFLVPLHHTFVDYLKAANGHALTTDGVHMNSRGDMLMANGWLTVMKPYIEKRL